MKKMIKQMGIDVKEIKAEEVIIKTGEFDYVFKNPSVTKITAKGLETFQIIGPYEITKHEVEQELEISDEDVKLIMEQAGVGEEEARKALEETKGDLAEALLRLQSK